MKGMPLAEVHSRADDDRLAAQWGSDPGVRAFLLQNLRRDDDGWRWQVNLDLLERSLRTLGSSSQTR